MFNQAPHLRVDALTAQDRQNLEQRRMEEERLQSKFGTRWKDYTAKRKQKKATIRVDTLRRGMKKTNEEAKERGEMISSIPWQTPYAKRPWNTIEEFSGAKSASRGGGKRKRHKKTRKRYKSRRHHKKRKSIKRRRKRRRRRRL